MLDDTDPSTGLAIGRAVNDEPARRPQRVVLQGSYVRLAPLDAALHGASLYELTRGPENDALWLYLFEGPFGDHGSFEANLREKARSEDPLYYAILDAESGRAMGHAAFLRIEPRHGVIEVGSILYSPPFQKTRGATEAMYLMARYAFEELGYRRYEWKCNALNEPSRRAALRLGFTFEGVFRQHMIVKGRNRDTAWFAMLDSEWADRKARFERWLSATNFDAAGRQREPLSGGR